MRLRGGGEEAAEGQGGERRIASCVCVALLGVQPRYIHTECSYQAASVLCTHQVYTVFLLQSVVLTNHFLTGGASRETTYHDHPCFPVKQRQGAAVVLAKEVPRAVAKTLLPGLFKKPGVGEQTSALENSGLFGCFFLLICASDFFLTCQSITCCGQGNACSINKQSLDKDVGVGAEKKLAM